MNVIKFPEPNRPPQPPAEQPYIADGLDAAFEVHRMIFNVLFKSMEPLRDNPGAFGPALLFAMSHHFGPDLVHWAEQQFENVYGIDPRGFIDHVTAYRA